MSERFRSFYPRDQAPDTLGDRGWVGVDARREPHKVAPGFVSHAENCRFRAEVAETRLGSIVEPWLNKIVGTAVNSWTTIHGLGVFHDPGRGQSFVLLAVDGGVYLARSGNAPSALALPAGVTLSGQVRFTQAFGTVLLWRGVDEAPLQMTDVNVGFLTVEQTQITLTRTDTTATLTMGVDHLYRTGDLVTIKGADQAEYNGTFEIVVVDSRSFTYEVEGSPVTPATGEIRVDDNGTEVIPNASDAVFLQNRLFIPTGQDYIAVSDYGDYTRYVPVVQEMRINQGSSDALVAVAKFNEATLIAFKERSIFAVYNVYGNLGAVEQDTLTPQFGLVAKRSIAQVGKDLWFLSPQGVMSLRQTEQNEIQGLALPISEPMEGIIKRINWIYAENAVAAYVNNKYYLALPIDDAELLGPELATGVPYDPTPEVVIGDLVVGATYRWTKDDAAVSLTNGSETLTDGGLFVAQGTSVTIAASSPPEITAECSVRRVWQGVNNAVLVYDVLNQAWAGIDTGPELAVEDFVVVPIGRRQELAFISPQGYVYLYEQDYEDQRALPYVDVKVTSAPLTGDSLQVNSGDTITADTGLGGNIGLAWATPNLVSAQSNLWGLDAGSSGYAPRWAGARWSAPNTAVVILSDGIRFYGTNGAMPEVVTTGAWAAMEYHPTDAIEATIETREYSSERGMFGRTNRAAYALQTWAPQLDVETITAGVEETETHAEDQTRSRTQYDRPAGKADWDPSNDNDDFLTPGREDYSVVLPDAGLALGSGVALGLHQEWTEQLNLNTQARGVRLRFRNKSGRMRLMEVRAEEQSRTSPAGGRT